MSSKVEKTPKPPPSSREVPPPPPSMGFAKPTRFEGRVRIACVLALVALGLMAWSQFDPSPIPVIVAMSVGQAIGTLSLAYYGIAILAEMRQKRIIDRLLGERKGS